ncbi:hypothetical protein DL766_008322 [Monosporascus sp. MC13-8B]|uniref:Killer toxin Kp4 domain-containing protein n=1 Tax=Monosporascus cannonballus TaxID=155416 RepID=A0ABY0GY53_9PEZI|nr:hypothetical protein DL762_007862 [Monosporascus cannonballus]RYO82405.1 hypothetical protein DL763_008256 [Monosporascus cannonballus]RYP19968.1 hypothetical protein DL766_008322 [Monosporascus sp. MC13-8B]
MRFTIFTTTLLAGLASADRFDCAGSGMCGSAINFVWDCDIAVSAVLIRNNDYNYGAAGSGKHDSAQRGRCKIFIAGPQDCIRTGNQMWNNYQEIRRHGCARCGSKHWGMDNTCRTTVNYVS